MNHLLCWVMYDTFDDDEWGGRGRAGGVSVDRKLFISIVWRFVLTDGNSIAATAEEVRGGVVGLLASS